MAKGYLQLRLNTSSEKNLKEKAKYPNVFCHHVTILFGVSEDDEQVQQLLKVGEMSVFGKDIYMDDKAQAVSVNMLADPVALTKEDKKLLEEIGKIKDFHVTISTQEGVKPVYSNELLKNPSAEKEPFNQLLKGKMEFFKFGSKEY